MPGLHIDVCDRLLTWDQTPPKLLVNGTKNIMSIADKSTPTASSTSLRFEDNLQNGNKTESHSYPGGFDDDAVCVVGMACRLPGDVRSPDGLWDFLVKKKSGQGRVPAQRFNIDGFHHKDDSRAGVMSADGGYFLNEDVRQFDNGFFGINNLEATYMDPHQRKLLEVVYECFESTGLSMDDISGTNTGVYASNFTVDYTNMHFRDPDYLHRYSSTGSNMAIVANRISHVFNLHGPSLSLNTACSSSLYCLHTAIRAIASGDCDDAIVAGANLIMSPEQHLETMKGGVLSGTSSCHTFDESADGYGRAEGVNAVYLKRLSSALRDGNKIWGVIRGSAVNSNGRTPGIAQPSAELQEAVIRKAYSHAGLDLSDTDYIECHGTGTAIGDAIEIDALGRCFPPREGSPLLIGSIKSSMGHSEAASGLTSLIKVLLTFEHAKIPPTFGVKKLNPKLRLDSLNMKVVTEAEEWPRPMRRVSINSFGYGGSNSHVILESFDSYLGRESLKEKSTAPIGDQILVLPVSTKSDKSLELRLQQISTMAQTPAVSLSSLTLSLTQRASHFRNRQFLLARPNSYNGLDSIQILDSGSTDPLPLAFVFTGQGAQYEGMAKELFLENGIFRETIRKLDGDLQSLPPGISPSWSLEQAITELPKSTINQATHSQPLSTAIQIGLVDLLRSWDISPTAVVGHSSGEIAAAYAAGLLTAAQSIIVAFLRGYAVSQIRLPGAMIAAGLEPQAAKKLIAEKNLTKEACVACVNDLENVTLSGSREAIEIIFSKIHSQRKFVRKLETGNQAYHSHLMKGAGAYYEELIAPYLNRGTILQDSESTVTMYSSVGYLDEETGPVKPGRDMVKYWRENLEKPVQFSSALQAILNDGDYHLVEIGPHHALQGPIKRIKSKLGKSHLPYSSTLARNQSDNFNIKKLAGTLFTHGHSLNWSEVNALPKGTELLHNIPPYPWDYPDKLLWYEPRASIELRNRKYLRHELLGSQQLAGNGVDWAWRNILRLNEIAWIRDHKLENQIVFPAAAYLAMATEAVSQAQDLHQKLHRDTGFEFRNVSFSAAFVLQDDGIETEKVELHTTLTPRKLSTTTSSSEWYDFSISSWAEGQTTVHCTGSIRIARSSAIKGTAKVSNTEGYETSPSMDRWYEKLREEGLNFGPHFKSVTSLSTDGTRRRGDAISTTQLLPHVKSSSGYVVHPIVIDACIQAAIFGGTGGTLSTLRAHLPVFISECRINGSKIPDAEATIHTQSTKTGISTRKIDCTLRSPNGDVVLDMNMRMSEYTSKLAQGLQDTNDIAHVQRHPCLRVRWKPDIMRLDQGSESQFKSYIDEFIMDQHPDMADDMTLSIIGALLDLAGHKTPSMRVLELGGGCGCKTKEWLSLLDKDTAFPRFRNWERGNVSDNGSIELEGEAKGPFDVILIPGHAASKQCWKEASVHLLERLSNDRGLIITRKTEEAVATLREAQFALVDVGHKIILGIRRTEGLPLKDREVLIVYRDQSPVVEELVGTLSQYLQQYAGVGKVQQVALSTIRSIAIDPNVVCISLLELEHEFLASMNSDDMDLLRVISNTVNDIAWVTGTQALKRSNPRLTMSSGLSRSLMLEQPSLRFSVIDIGAPHVSDHNTQTACRNILKALVPQYDMDDKEFTQDNDLLFISRFYPDASLNSTFQRRLGSQVRDQIQTATLTSAEPARLAIGKVGVMDTVHFQQLCEPAKELPVGFVDIQVKAVSLNAKDVYNLNGRVEVRDATTACEFTGVVVAAGPDVTNVQLGDRVVAMVPNYFTTTERVPAWTVHKLLPGEKFTEISTLPVAYSTALIALHDCARLRSGESVLIHGGSGALGIAAINIAQNTGAVIYTTASSQAKKDFLVSQFGIPASNIFSSRDTSFVDGIKNATGGRGVDVVLNSLVGDLMHASWSCVASFGRFVEVGKRELIDAGKLDMAIFQRNATFTAFDLSEMFYSKDPFQNQAYASKMKEALEWHRSGHVKLGPMTVFDIADIAQAYRYFSSKDRIGKVVVSLENSQSRIQVVEPKYRTILDPNKTYLLIGCLGGLGRSIGRWMAARGARHLVFLGRSGCDKPSAKKFVSLLQSMGVESKVIKGDVLSSEDVTKAIRACVAAGRLIGGVIQAAMGLHEALFSRMTNAAWHQGIDAKWTGTWNLHSALEGHDEALEFFLLTSSISGTVGIATEANYCASNGFLDAFARWRREQGKPATSIGLGMISEVGYLHENPDIQNILLRKGIYPLSEDEFLQVIDFALAAGVDTDPEDAHILTGMESFGFRNLMAKGFDVNNLPMLDPRSSILAEALEAEQTTQAAADDGKQGRFAANTAVWAKELPAVISGSLLAEADAASLRDAVLRVIRKQFSNLILTPLDQIEDGKPLAQFGVDSMIASEFRTWFWATFKVDIPFLDLLSATRSLSSLADTVETKLKGD
ncbi:putative polyketide synthase [Annulohypoxylon bovei var. microspora]|nr:putative polyketide synthase [Annulohypoxylon bovei var. microspora]